MATSAEALTELKQQLWTTWTDGDYGRVAEGLAGGAESFYRRLSIEPGTAVLDVACGAGQIAIPAARDGARVTGLDLWNRYNEATDDSTAVTGEILEVVAVKA